jgi:uncharacterized protein YjbI with pentapeptide repeats
MKKSRFIGCSLVEVDFATADLSGAVFDKSNLSMAVFKQTNLENADFRAAENYALDPAENRMKKAKFSASGLAGLLSKYNLVIE